MDKVLIAELSKSIKNSICKQHLNLFGILESKIFAITHIVRTKALRQEESLV